MVLKKIICAAAVLCAAVLMVSVCFAGVSAAEDIIINLIPEGATLSYTNLEDATVTASFVNGEFVAVSTAKWPSVTLNYDEPITAKVANAYIEFEAVVENGAASIALRGPGTDEENTDDIFLHHFQANASLDTGSGDIYSGTISYTLALKDMGFCHYAASDNYAGIIPITGEDVTFMGLSVCPVGENAKITIKKLNLIISDKAPAASSEDATSDEATSEPAAVTSETASETASEAISETASVSSADSTSADSTGDSSPSYIIWIVIAAVAIIAAATVVIVRKKAH